MQVETLPASATNQPLLADVGVLALVPDGWGPRWMTRHHIMTRLARYFHTVWVNPAHGWRERLAGQRAPASQEVVAAPCPGFIVYRPEFWLPEAYRPAWLAKLSLQQRLTRARRLLMNRGCRKLILYLWRPEFEPALRLVPFDLSCYHLEDEYSFSRVELPVDPVEARLLAEVDQVFILSPALFEKKGRFNPHTAYVPGGVDYGAYACSLAEPRDLAPIPHPRIGYIGSLKWQLDWPLLLHLTREHPEWSFVFVGPKSPHPEIGGATEELSRRPNVHFLGAKPTEGMVAYPQHFDVCIMPYGVNDYTKYIYPLKLHEYLATGRPTVGAQIRSLEEFADVVALPRTANEWSAAISEALSPAGNTAERRTARQQTARRYDWQGVVAQVAQILAQRLGPAYADRLADSPGPHSEPQENP